MNKIKLVDIVIFILLAILIIFNIKYINLNSEKKEKIVELNQRYSKIKKNILKEKSFLGKKFDLGKYNFKSYRNKKRFSYNFRGGKKYLFLIVVGKANCNSCIGEFAEFSKKIDDKIEIAALVYSPKSHLISRIIKSYNFNYPIYFSDTSKWFDKNNLLIGPTSFLIDIRSRKIINSYFDYKDNNINNKKIYMNSVLRLLQ